MYKNAIKDCLHNLSLRENKNASATDEQKAYYNGLIIGIISGLMHAGYKYETAAKLVNDAMPFDKIEL